ncbi:MAG: hypothetical protein NXY59_07560 [Aigarchaeota archaeon]|nr:hypothetical protein [Candidatus Pelearchaeum maunauluense]
MPRESSNTQTERHNPETTLTEFYNLFAAIVTPNGVKIIKFHMRRILGEEPAKVLEQNPKRFAEAFTQLFGCEEAVRIVEQMIISHFSIELESNKSLIGMLKEGRYEEFNRTLSAFNQVRARSGSV